MKLCPCGRYRQLNSVLYANNHILKSSKIIFNGLVLKAFFFKYVRRNSCFVCIQPVSYTTYIS